jgi:hypothetical protein
MGFNKNNFNSIFFYLIPVNYLNLLFVNIFTIFFSSNLFFVFITNFSIILILISNYFLIEPIKIFLLTFNLIYFLNSISLILFKFIPFFRKTYYNHFIPLILLFLKIFLKEKLI